MKDSKKLTDPQAASTQPVSPLGSHSGEGESRRSYANFVQPLGECRYLTFRYSAGFGEWTKDAWMDRDAAWFELGHLCTWHACNPHGGWEGFGIACAERDGSVSVLTSRITHDHQTATPCLPEQAPWFARRKTYTLDDLNAGTPIPDCLIAHIRRSVLEDAGMYARAEVTDEDVFAREFLEQDDWKVQR